MFKFSLKTKLISLQIVLILLLISAVVTGFFSLNRVNKNLEHVAKKNLAVFVKATAMSGAVYAIRGDLNRIAFQFKEPSVKAEMIQSIEEHISNYETAVAGYNDLGRDSAENEVYEPVEQAWGRVKSEVLTLIDLAKKSENAEDETTYQKRAIRFGILLNAYRVASDAWIDYEMKDSAEWVIKSETDSKKANSIFVIIATVGIIFGLGIGYFVTNRLAKKLISITESVDQASVQVSSASGELSNAAEKLSSGSQQQASSLEETSASLTEISGMAESNVKGAEQADYAAKEVYEISEKTRKSMDELSSAMGEILKSNIRIEKLVKLFEEIGEKTQVIDDIVFKTQLLSFNASVEAERAGEHGRGFAVVAQEVGNLAQLSGKAAVEISSIVKNSVKEAEAVATENKSRVTNGGELAKETREQMEQVLARLNDIIESISKIVGASKEQGQGINQISTSVESISHLTQETASTAEETASASSQLSVQSHNLVNSVNELKEIVTGKKQSVNESTLKTAVIQ